LCLDSTQFSFDFVIEQQGKVLHLQGDSANVQIGATSGCPACDAGKGCGAGVFGRLLQRKPVIVELENTIGAQAGQSVSVGIPDSVFLRLLLRLYLFPLVAGLAGAGLGHYLGLSILGLNGSAQSGLQDIFTLAGAVLAGGMALWSGRHNHSQFTGRVRIRLLRVVSGPLAGQCEPGVIPGE